MRDYMRENIADDTLHTDGVYLVQHENARLNYYDVSFDRAVGMSDILDAPWPAVDETALKLDHVELVLQVNGKLRGNMRVAKDADRAQIEELAMQNANVQKHIGGQPVKKVVVVPGRLVNVVV